MKIQLDNVCRRWGLLVIVVASCLVYANTLDNDFVLDDTSYIQGNYLLRDLGNLPLFFNVPPDSLVEDLPSGFLRGRNIRWVTYAVDFALGQGAPWVFHLSNVLWHTLTGVGLFFLFRRWTKGAAVALLSAVLFIVHPIQTSSVAYISGRKDILATFFLCAAFLAIYRYRETARRWWLSIVVVLFFLAFFSKEVAVVFPALLVLSDWCLATERRGGEAIVQCVKRYWREYLWCSVVAGVFVWWRLGPNLLSRITSFLSSVQFQPAVPPGGVSQVVETNLSYANLMLFYLAKLTWPVNLLADYRGAFDFSVYPEQYGAIVSIAFVALLTLCMVILRGYLPLAALGVGWIFIALLPVSHIVDFHYPVAEHYLYLPCAGFVLMVGSVAEFDKFKRLVFLLTFCAIVLCSVLSWSRNHDWQNMETITLDVLKKAPQHQRARNSMVHILAEQGRYDAALEHAQVVLAENPTSAINNYNLGFLYEGKKELALAEFYYRRAITLQPTLWSAYLNLGNMLLESGAETSGTAVLHDLNSRYGYHPLSYWVLGMNQARQEKWTEALTNFEWGLKLDASDARLKLGVAVALWSMGREPERVERLYREVLKTDALESVEINQPPWNMFFSQVKFRAGVNK